MYTYEPDFEDPYRELEVCMNFYRTARWRLEKRSGRCGSRSKRRQ